MNSQSSSRSGRTRTASLKLSLRALARLCAIAFVASIAGNAAAIETGTKQQIEPAPASTPAPRRASPAPAKAAPMSQSSESGGLGLAGRERTDAGPHESADSGRHAFDDRFWLAAMLGYASNVYQGGIGIRGGKALDNHLYIGGSFVYHLGESTAGPTINGVTNSTSAAAFYTGPEVGYDFDLRSVVLRPYGGLGFASIIASSTVSGPGIQTTSASSSNTRFVVWPGFSVIWNPPQSRFFLGGDVRVVSVPDVAFSVFAFGGMYFGDTSSDSTRLASR
jgi:hypothetical protein